MATFVFPTAAIGPHGNPRGIASFAKRFRQEGDEVLAVQNDRNGGT